MPAPNPFDQFDAPKSNPFDQFDPPKPTLDSPVKGEFQGDPAQVQSEIDGIIDPTMKALAQKAYDQQYGKSGIVDTVKGIVAPSFMESSAPVPKSDKLPLGIPKASGVLGDIQDVLYGVPEAVVGLASGIGTFIGGQATGAPKVLEGLPGSGEEGSLTRGLAEAQRQAEKFGEGGGYTPVTSTGQLLLKPIEVLFGTAMGSIDRAVRTLSKDISLEEVENRVKAAQYVFNSALLGLPHVAKKLGKGKALTSDETKQVRERIKQEASDAKVDEFDEALKVLREESTPPPAPAGEATFKGNQDIVDALNVEGGRKQGYGKRAYTIALEKALQHPEEITPEALSIFGKDPKKGTRKFVADLLSRRAKNEIKTVRFYHGGIPGDGSRWVTPDIKYAQGYADKSGGIIQYIDVPENSPLLQKSFDDTGTSMTAPYVHFEASAEMMKKAKKMEDAQTPPLVEGQIEPHTSAPLESPANAPEWMGGEIPIAETAPVIPPISEVPTDAIKVMDLKGKPNIPEVEGDTGFESTPVAETVTHTPGDILDVGGIKVKYDGAHQLGEMKLESITIQEGPAKGATRSVRDLEPATIEAEVKKAEEVFSKKVEEMSTPVASIAETPKSEIVIPEFYTLEELKSKFDVGVDIPKEQALLEAEVPEAPEFGVAKVGDKYYRTVVKSEMPRERGAAPKVEEERFKFEDDEYEPTESELKAEELGLKKLLEEQVPEVDPVKAKEVRPEILAGLDRWKKRYVEKINAGKPAPVEPSDLAPVNPDFAIFKTEAEARAYAEASGVEPERVKHDGLSDQWIIEPKFEDLDDYGWETSLEDVEEVRSLDRSYDGPDSGYDISSGGLRDLVDIINNERGSVDITALRNAIEKRKEVLRLMKELGKTADDFLSGLGMKPESVEAFKAALARLPQDEQKLRKLDPITEGLVNPEPATVMHQRVRKLKNGTIRTHIPITDEYFDAVFKAPKRDWDLGKLSGRFMEATETRLHGFERYNKTIKKLFWDKWIEKLSDSEKERKSRIVEAKRLRGTLSKGEREGLAIAWAADQKGGVEALRADGITEIPLMNAKQLAVRMEMNKKFGELLDRINYVRSKIGLAPIPKLENYFPFIRQQNALRNAGILDSLVATPLSRIQANSTRFKGTFFPFEKPRGKSQIPIELDVFNAYEQYLSYAMKEIHITPVAALAKELAGERIKPRGMKSPKSAKRLVDTNPGLAKLLINWSDEILGIDTVTNVTQQKHPFIARTFSDANRNLVAAMIFGNVGTVLKQPTALKGTFAMTSIPDFIYGISKLMVEKPIRWGETTAQKKSRVLDIRRSELLISEFVESIQLGTIKGGKKLAIQVTSAPMNIVDMLTAEASWNAGYSHAKRVLKLGEPEAIVWADDLVAKTQGMGIRGAVASIQTTRALKWLTMLQTYAIADFNFLARDILGIKNPDIKKSEQVKRVVKYIVGASLINQAFQFAGMDAPNPSPIQAYNESMDETDDRKVAMAKVAMEFAEMIPLLGGSAKYGSSLMGPVGELASDIPKGVTEAVKALDWERMSDKQKFNTALFIGEMLGMYYGIPMTRQIKKSLRTASQGGNPYEIILGIYIEEARKGGEPPGFSGMGGLEGLGGFGE